LIEAPTVGIGRLLKEGGRFLIPHHQRDYSWTEDELDQLFKDVYDAKDSGQGEYFVGLMVFKPESERVYTILDGQQRLATTVMLGPAPTNTEARPGRGLGGWTGAERKAGPEQEGGNKPGPDYTLLRGGTRRVSL
jgi:Protein of unknown function DUF262